MTKEEAFKRAKSNYEAHKIAAESWSSPALVSGERERAEICKMIVDVFSGITPTGTIKEALFVLKREEREYKTKFAYSMAESIYTNYSEEYKRCVDWYSCCIEALESYLFEYGSED